MTVFEVAAFVFVSTLMVVFLVLLVIDAVNER